MGPGLGTRVRMNCMREARPQLDYAVASTHKSGRVNDFHYLDICHDAALPPGLLSPLGHLYLTTNNAPPSVSIPGAMARTTAPKDSSSHPARL